MWRWLKKVFSVNHTWTDSFMSKSFRQPVDIYSHDYEPPESETQYAYHTRDTRRSIEPTVVVKTDNLTSKPSRIDAVKMGISPGNVFMMRESEEQSPNAGTFTLVNYK